MEKKSKYVNYTYNEKDEYLVNLLDDYLNEKAEDIYSYFDPNLSKKPIDVVLCHTKKEFDEKVSGITNRKEIPNWMIGLCATDSIYYLSLDDYKNTTHAFPEDKYDENLDIYKKSFVHEYVHNVTYRYFMNKYPDKKHGYVSYTSEGIAQYLSGQRDNETLDFNYTLDEIKGDNCYKGWFVLTKYILDNYDKEYFLELVSDDDYAEEELPRLYEETKSFYDSKKDSHEK